MSYPKRNCEGYSDPTPYKALNKNAMDPPTAEEDERFHKFLGFLFHVCDMFGYRIQNRIVIEDKTNGRIWD